MEMHCPGKTLFPYACNFELVPYGVLKGKNKICLVQLASINAESVEVLFLSVELSLYEQNHYLQALFLMQTMLKKILENCAIIITQSLMLEKNSYIKSNL